MRSRSSTATERGDERLAYLQQAELRLRRLDERYPDSSETLGLLGSAAKRMVEMCLRAGRSPDPHLERAIDAYRRGLAADPGDYYPGVNAVTLLRLRGQHHGGGERDLTEARELLPVVRFGANRQPLTPTDTWQHATLAELALDAHLLDPNRGHGALDEAAHHYGIAAHGAPGKAEPAIRQLELLVAARDPTEVVQPLLSLVRSAAEGF